MRAQQYRILESYVGIVCMKAMNAAHRPRIAWTMRSMFDNDDDINYLTASMVLSFILSRCPGWRHVALQDVRRHLALTEEEKMDVIESVEGEAYTVKPQSIANEGDLVIIPHNFTIIPPAIAWPTVVATKEL